MRQWKGNRGRRTRPAEASGEQEHPREPENDVQPATSPARSAEEAQPETPGAASGGSRSGNREKGNRGGRGRRRKKKPRSGPGPQPKAEPIVPAYTDTEGPRAPSPVAIFPGEPTGEAAELEVPPAPPLPAVPAPSPVPAATKRTPKGAVVLSVGLPGSGKTTWFKRKGVTPLSSDLLRTLLFDDPTVQRHQDLVFSSLRYLLRARLMARMPMNYVDATNLSPKERRHWIRMAREFGYEVHAVYFEVPLQTCLERNRKRQRIVPEDVMQRMAAKLRPPTFEEGFSKIIVVRVKHRPLTQETGEQPVSDESLAEPQLDEHFREAETDESPGGPEPDESSGEPEPGK